jgi:MerR family transcriptional regulator, mercuric resistance operon regulatory protein
MPPPDTKSRAERLPIGGLSRDTGVNIETIRYYERIGLLPPPPRSDGGHRLYDDGHRQRLVFIRRSRQLGFSLDEVRDLLGLARGHELTCAEVKTMTEQHVGDIRRKVKDLKKLERVLTDLAAQCHGKKVPHCPILEALGGRGGDNRVPETSFWRSV